MANDSALGGGGVLFTFILNIIIATIIFVLLGTCLRRLSPFAWEKKRKLFARNLEQRNLYAEERDQIAQEPDNKNYLVEIGNEDRPLAKNRIVRYVQQRILFTWALFKGLFYPVHDEERCMDNYGRDISAYFLFSRAIIYAFVFMTIVGLAVLLPLHLTGTLPEQYSTPVDGVTPDAGIVYTTINMITTSPARMSATIILTFFFTLAFLLLCVAYYAVHPMNSVHNWRQHDERKSSMRGLEALKPSGLLMDNVAMIDRVTNAPVKDPLLVCPYSLEIDGLPSTLISQTAFRAMIGKVMTRDEPNKFGSTINDIITANLVHDIKDRLDLAQKKDGIVRNIEHLNYVRAQKDREGVEQKPVNKTLLCKKYDGKRQFKNSVDAMEYELTQLADVEREISRWDDMYKLLAQQTGNVNEAMQVQDMEVGEISDSGFEGRQRGARPLAGLPNQFLDKKGNDKEYKLRSSGNAYIVFRSLNALKDFERNFRKQRPNVEEALQMQQQQLGNEVTEGGVFGAIGGVGNKLTGGMSAKAMNFASLNKNRVKYEPGDVMWDNLFVRTRISRAVPIIRKTISVVLIVLLIIFCSTPTAFATSIQRLLEGGVFPGINIRNIGFLTSGTLGALIFQYVPTLLLMLASILIPMIIIGLTMFEKNKSRGLIQTLTMKRIYVYLLLSTLVLPILVQASMDGLVNGFINGGANYALIFGNIFLPNGGSFFINYVLQKLLIGNMLAYVMVGMIVKYLILARFTSPYWKKLKMYRYITPLEHLDTAELTDINVEMAYANMLSIAAIGLTLGVFTPVVIPCCLAFFLGQYWVDRYNVSTIYGQRKLVYKVQENANIVGSSAYGVRSDFVTHTKIVRQVCELVWANCIVFTFFMTFFFAARIAQNNGFIGHTIVAAIICIACILGAILTKIIGKYYFLSNGRLDRQNGEVRPNEANVDQGYDPTTIDGMVKMKGGLGTLGFQLVSRGI